MIKGVIFDLDGLLIDSEPYWREADFLLAKKYGLTITDEFRKQLFGNGLKENAIIFINKFKLKDSIEVFTQKRLKLLYKILFNKLRLMPYSLQLIRELKKNNYILALATAGHDLNTTKKILNKLSIINYFSYIISGSDVKRSKPYPDIYIKAAEMINLPPKECIALEDTVNGVIAGKRAGIRMIGVNKNLNVRNEMKKIPADFVFRNLNIPITIFQ